MNAVFHKLRIASARHLAYAPQYIASELGFFAREGVDVSFVSWPAGDSAIAASLRHGEADLVLGSVLFALRMHDDGLEPRVVAQSNQQTRHWIMARPGYEGRFAWSDLRGRSIMVYPNNVPTPWVAFRQALFQQGIRLDDIKPIIGYTAEQSVAEFCRGVGDFLLVDPESVDLSRKLAEVASVASVLGPVPWSVYCAIRERTGALGGLDAFRNAIAAAVRWLYSEPPRAAAEALTSVFPDTSRDVLAGQIARHVEARLWHTRATLDAGQVARWDTALKRCGLMPESMNLRNLCGD